MESAAAVLASSNKGGEQEPSVVWTDITALCKAAAGELTFQTPMINVADFSLYDSMSAVEVR
jgi:hypothetical protein